MSFFFIALTALMALVIVLDTTRYLIPNWVVGLLLALYPLMLLLSPLPVEWPTALAVMAGFFVLGLGIFALNWMGGGDVKLLIVSGLWMGLPALAEFTLWVAVLGGLLSLVLLLGRPSLVWIFPLQAREGRLPKIAQKGAPVPYGIAIAAGFLIMLWQGKIPGLAL